MKASFTSIQNLLFSALLLAATFPCRSEAGEPEAFTESPNAAGAVTIDVAAYASPCGRWTYRHTENGVSDTWHDEVHGTKIRNGQPVYLIQSYDANGYPNDQIFLDTDMSKGLFATGGLNDYGDPSQSTYFFKPRLPRLMKTFVPGMAYIANYTRTDLGVFKVSTVIEPAKITVPFGTLDCYKVTRKVSDSGKVVVEQWEWYAKNLGVVKYGETPGGILELVSYQAAPRMVVEQPTRSILVDGKTKKSFGTMPVGKSGTSKTFTIKNTGTSKLTSLTVQNSGSHSKDFIVTGPSKKSLAPGASTTFQVTFQPTAKGTRKATIRIKSNDADENPFDINLIGLGVNTVARQWAPESIVGSVLTYSYPGGWWKVTFKAVGKGTNKPSDEAAENMLYTYSASGNTSKIIVTGEGWKEVTDMTYKSATQGTFVVRYYEGGSLEENGTGSFVVSGNSIAMKFKL